MAVLLHKSGEEHFDVIRHPAGYRIGTSPDAHLRVPSGLGVEPLHVTVTQSEIYRVSVLVDCARSAVPVLVNDVPVALLKALQHRDRISIGAFEMTYWEVVVAQVRPGSAHLGKSCQVCFDVFTVGDEVVRCPRCDSPHHRPCWFYLDRCSYYGCGYPVQEITCQILTPPFRFEELSAVSPAVKEKRTCPAGQARDIADFRARDHVAQCPSCSTFFHTTCWLGLSRCPKCSYDVASLLQRAFVPGTSREGSQT